MFGLAPNLNVLLGEGLLPVAEDLVLEVVEGEGVVHGEFGLGGVRPSWPEGDGEVADAVAFDGEGGAEGGVDGEVVPVFGVVGLPGYLDVPVPLGVVDDGQILSHFASGRDVHLEDGLEGLGLDGEDEPVPADIGLGLVANEDVGGELVDGVFAYDREGYFVLNRQHFLLAFFPLDLCLLLGLFRLLGSSWLVNYSDCFFGGDVGVGSDVNVEGFLLGGLSRQGLGVLGVLLGLAFFIFLKVVDGLPGSADHLVLGVELVVPVGDLVDAEGHGGPDFSSDGGWLNRGDDLVLELADDLVDEKDGGFGGEHAHGDVVKGEGGRGVLADLDVIALSKYGLHLQGLRQGRGGILPLQVLAFEYVFRLVCYLEVDQFAGGEFVGDFDRELYLLVQ